MCKQVLEDHETRAEINTDMQVCVDSDSDARCEDLRIHIDPDNVSSTVSVTGAALAYLAQHHSLENERQQLGRVLRYLTHDDV